MTPGTAEPDRAPPAGTVLAALVAALREAAAYNRDADLAPLAILWPDGAEQWGRAAPELRPHLPLLTLGDYDPERQTGPAIWIRAELATREPDGETPIIYLPGYRRELFRNPEEAPPAIRPLLYLQYRGGFFLQPNGKDWTMPAFLHNARHGLGLTVDGGETTRGALAGAARLLLHRRIDDLRRHPGGIDADFLANLVITDMPRALLGWLDDPEAARRGLGEEEWTAFAQQLRTKYGVDAERDGPSEAAARLGGAAAGSYWLDVWNRFAESPASYPNIPAKLRGAKPAAAAQRDLFGSAESHYHWPQDNEAAEAALRQVLLAFDDAQERDARQTILRLAPTHAPRRQSVWAKLGQTPLADALAHLAVVAEGTRQPFPAGSVAAMRTRYAEAGWTIDAAALDALAAVFTAEDRQAVDAALDAIYTPWLWTTAERFQQALADAPPAEPPRPRPVPAGTCVLFADGLRYDLAARLAADLRRDGVTVDLSSAIGPLPGVTPSAKPAQTPVVAQLAAGPKLNVTVAATGTPLSQTSLKKLLAEHGWAFLDAGETGRPDDSATAMAMATATAWTEAGQIDSYGHNHPRDLPKQAWREIDSIRTRVRDLLAAGWPRVVVVTDHGWLLTPRAMPKTELPQHLTVERKGRCARLTPGAAAPPPTVPWCWDRAVTIAMAPGISCFEDGKRYEHGGLSPQECVLPTLTATGGAAPATAARIAAITWRGLRCLVELEGGGPALSVDVRLRASDAATSIAAGGRAVAAGGDIRVLIDDDAHEGSSAIVVVLDHTGQPVAQRATIVGEA